jgi:hypothetical protein
MTDPQLAIIMMGLFIALIFLGFPIAFTLLALAVFFGFYAMDFRILNLIVTNTGLGGRGAGRVHRGPGDYPTAGRGGPRAL